MTTRSKFVLMLVIAGSALTQSAAAQQRGSETSDNPELPPFEQRIGDILNVADSSISLRLCVAEERADPPIPAPPDNQEPAGRLPAADKEELPDPAITGATGAGFSAGAEVTFLRPYAGGVSDLELTVPTFSVDLHSSFPANSFGVGPRFWIGYNGCTGTGVRARYWQFDQQLNSQSSDVTLDGFLPLPSGSHRVGSGLLNMYEIDCELTQHVETSLFGSDVGIGIAVAGLDRESNLKYIIPGLPDTTLGYGRTFTGIGPTLSAEIRRPIGDSAFTLLINSRGSTLFGQRGTSVYIDNELALGGVTWPIVNFRANTDATLFIGEVRMGVEWSRTLSGGRKLLAHALWENQFWAGSGVGISSLGMTGGAIGFGIAH